jgi:Putative peptidoglycan binding domain
MEQSRRARGRLRRWVLLMAVLCVGATAAAAPSAAGTRNVKAHTAQANALLRRGMWIWVLSASDGGNLGSIIAQAHRYGIGTLYIKAGDGSGSWSQFSHSVVSRLHAAGISVCGWQYVYGTNPIAEAQVGANAVHAGADCLVIDAESEYEGKYYSAQRYISRLRQLIGTGFPLALAGFPYVDYHPSFPYSVFLGRYGAQYNVPQMYWVDIGTSVPGVYAHTFVYNRVYERPIEPLGQVYNGPPPAQIRAFRQLVKVYGSTGVSWWDWQEAQSADWRAVSTWVPGLAYTTAVPGMPTLSKGAAGDLVVWAQEHLITAGDIVAVDGGFGAKTLAAVEAFQLQHGLTQDGVLGSQTWAALLQYQPASISWAPGATRMTTRMRGRISAAAVAATDTKAPSTGPTPGPASALLPDKGSEIPRSLGAGRPPIR